MDVKVPTDKFESMCKAAIDHIDHEHAAEQQDSFVRKNPAARNLAKIVSDTYEAMSFSMLKEISKVFSDE